MTNPKKKHSDSTLIDDLGGTTKAAKFFDVKPPSISEWRINGIPRPRMMYLKLARPDLFGGKTKKIASTEAKLIPGTPIDDKKVREAKGNLGRKTITDTRKIRT